MKTKSIVILALSYIFLISCGREDKSSKPSSPQSSQVERYFNQASQEHKIPVRFLIAVAFLESGLSAKESTASPLGNTTKLFQHLALKEAETVFNISFEELGISGSEKKFELETQIKAYAGWLRKKLDEAKAELSNQPTSNETKFQWLWQISQIQRSNENLQKRNTRAFYVKSLINILNSGAVWFDTAEQKAFELKSEHPQIKLSELKDSDQKLLKMRDDSSEAGAAAKGFEVVRGVNKLQALNKAQKVMITHCPFELTKCIELQSVNIPGLQAHYLIPPDQSVSDKALQVRSHATPVMIKDDQGVDFYSQDTIVVSLVGLSGRLHSGTRFQSNPNWFKPEQLSSMGNLVDSICNRLKLDNEALDIDTCRKPKNLGGTLEFVQQENLKEYRWGDIPDFDSAIFASYLTNTDHNLSGEAFLDTLEKRKFYNGGEVIRLKAQFPTQTKWLQLEKAVRCSNSTQQIQWATMLNEPNKNKGEKELQQVIEDGGPDANGKHYFRLLAYDSNNELIAWSSLSIQLQIFDSTLNFSAKPCERAM